jgi:hypothetical protein
MVMNALCLLISAMTALSLGAILLARAAMKVGTRDLAYLPVRERNSLRRQRFERGRGSGRDR